MPNKVIESLFWKLKTTLYKRLILLQDNVGFYSYSKWIRENEQGRGEFATQRSNVGSPLSRPSICCIILSDDGSIPALITTLESLSDQTLPNWEAYIPGSLPDIQNQFEPYLDRIQILPKGPSFLINSLQVTKCDYVQLIQAGDKLSPNALYEITSTLNNSPPPDIIYTDEDYIDVRNQKRHNPFFKPDWSPELLLSVNFLLHASFRRELIFEALRKHVAQTRLGHGELAIRCSEKAKYFYHIPKVLYHNHHVERNTFCSPGLFQEAECKWIEVHLNQKGISEAHAFVTDKGNIRVTWPTKSKLVSIIIPTKDHVDLLRHCLDSIRRNHQYPYYEIVVVDNDSIEKETWRYYNELKSDHHIRVVKFPGQFNYSAALNFGTHHSNGEIILFMNNDIEVLDPDWLEELVRWAERPEIGIVGAKLLYPDGSVQHAGIILGMEGHASHVFSRLPEDNHGIFGSVNWYRNFSAVTGACMAIRRDVFDEIGGFNENYLLAFSDVEICLRVIRAGYRIVYTPYARLIHREGMSRNKYIPSHDIRLAYEHLNEIIREGDPYYNPNLSLAINIPTFRRQNEDASLARLQNIVKYF